MQETLQNNKKKEGTGALDLKDVHQWGMGEFDFR